LVLLWKLFLLHFSRLVILGIPSHMAAENKQQHGLVEIYGWLQDTGETFQFLLLLFF